MLARLGWLFLSTLSFSHPEAQTDHHTHDYSEQSKKEKESEEIEKLSDNVFIIIISLRRPFGISYHELNLIRDPKNEKMKVKKIQG
ncbi:Hypothetical protein Minf_1221 [Methylacidiphilum infernorum V4]|uniref:Uncharacterized protein n=1 Tax=Methylacidiphilum infernorum (isolate V4) TaxID=481448 RepID=B3DVC2_METI4|nr:Hypothetical protein Minf_1221 [Methylacidiphilum infernorum V4]